MDFSSVICRTCLITALGNLINRDSYCCTNFRRADLGVIFDPHDPNVYIVQLKDALR